MGRDPGGGWQDDCDISSHAAAFVRVPACVGEHSGLGEVTACGPTPAHQHSPQTEKKLCLYTHCARYFQCGQMLFL